MDDNRQKREAVVAAPRRTTDEQRLKIERMMADPVRQSNYSVDLRAGCHSLVCNFCCEGEASCNS